MSTFFFEFENKHLLIIKLQNAKPTDANTASPSFYIFFVSPPKNVTESYTWGLHLRRHIVKFSALISIWSSYNALL